VIAKRRLGAEAELIARNDSVTKEGQAFKKWGANGGPNLEAEKKQADLLSRSRRIFTSTEAAKSGDKGKDDARVALEAHEGFDSGLIPRGGEVPPDTRTPSDPNAGPVNPNEVVVPQTGGSGGGSGADQAGEFNPDPSKPQDMPGATSGAALGVGKVGHFGTGKPSAFASRYRGPAGEVPDDAKAYGFVGYVGGGKGGGPRVAPSVEGLISLAPPLVESGRSYAFRKLDASAVLTVSARTPDIGRRVVAAAAFLAVVAAVWMLRRRRRRAS
jgi:hypothetical protein